MNGAADIGADELSQKQADFTRNGAINCNDFAVLAHSWLTGPSDDQWYALCDLFEDDYIDSGDLRLFVHDWLWQAAWY